MKMQFSSMNIKLTIKIGQNERNDDGYIFTLRKMQLSYNDTDRNAQKLLSMILHKFVFKVFIKSKPCMTL